MLAQVREVAPLSATVQVRIMLLDTCWHSNAADGLRRKTILQNKELRRSPMDKENPRTDQALGMHQRITRRDFVNATLLASGSMLLNPLSPADLLASRAAEHPSEDGWTGYGGIGDYAKSNGNKLLVVPAGNEVADGRFETRPAGVIDTGETYDCVVVAGDPSRAVEHSAQPLLERE